MDILKLLKEYANKDPEYPACVCGQTVMTYGELDRLSDGIAEWLISHYGDDRSPVVVYGHKHPLMIASFLGCSKAGKAYCPLDISLPPDRVDAIIKQSGASAVLAVEKPETAGNRTEGAPPVIRFEELARIAESGSSRSLQEYWLTDDDIAYIIFTSGSTGQPKGVQISCAALSGFTDWSVNLGSPFEAKRGARFLNQAPFSFDLSVMDLYTCLAVGGTLWPLTKEVQGSYALLFDVLKSADPAVWVSTPSFAELCLADPGFQGSSLPALRRMPLSSRKSPLPRLRLRRILPTLVRRRMRRQQQLSLSRLLFLRRRRRPLLLAGRLGQPVSPTNWQASSALSRALNCSDACFLLFRRAGLSRLCPSFQE